MRRAGRRDDNHREIVLALRDIPGLSVADTANLGDGFPDLVIGYRGVNLLVEIKDGSKVPSKQKLTESEQKFHNGWNGQVCVALTVDDVLNAIQQIKMNPYRRVPDA
jgi:hypothetical protein